MSKKLDITIQTIAMYVAIAIGSIQAAITSWLAFMQALGTFTYLAGSFVLALVSTWAAYRSVAAIKKLAEDLQKQHSHQPKQHTDDTRSSQAPQH